MKKLTILIPEAKSNLSSIVGTYKIFNRANDYWESLGNEPIFTIQLAGVHETVELYDGLFSIRPHTVISAVQQTDIIIIPSLQHDIIEPLQNNRELIDWIKQQHSSGAEIASICTGAFLLAATGLLDGKKCSTHWNAVEKFKELFPAVKVVPDKIITDEQGIYTNGGAFSFLNLILYLIEKYYDRQTAVYCAKVFQIDIDRNSQDPFTIFAGQKDHQDTVIQKAQAYIEDNITEKLSVETLAATFMINRRSFDRRFIKATGNTPSHYLQRVRIEAAKKAFETSSKTIHEIMYDVGYADIKAFREMFRKNTGLSPLEYKNKYNKKRI
ncbi:MAG TPA: helix-turn-helix domain-containing protein [Bacteroidia bacterium]|jgi:transcriptional regulator GlxA family with amidase domain|nr:helix-turn-helix domain-containing protein [Bacteroidia bacterium]